MRAIRASSWASSSAALTGRVPSSSRSAFRARAASSRHAFWRCELTRVAGADVGDGRPDRRTLGPLERATMAISPATNGVPGPAVRSP